MPAIAPASARRRLSPTERREHLLDLGLDLFGESSFDQLSTDEIADQAGISRGLLFHYFGSKRGYYVAVIREAADRLLDASQAVRDPPLDGDPQRVQLDVFLTFVEDNAGLYTLLMQSGVGVDRQVQVIVDETRAVIASRVAPALADDAEPSRGSAERFALVAWIGAVEAAAFEWADQRRRGATSLDQSRLTELLMGMLPPLLRPHPADEEIP
ncbi:MAG: TetR/AcrR family transcriptional regulator [Acidobacteriota bacterium]